MSAATQGATGTPADASPEALPAGTVIAERYRIEELLGEGGMGAVYRAEHVHMRKHVAVKVLHAGKMATAEAAARFEREAVAAANINHPNVAAATDFGQLPDGSFYLVLEYIGGKSLRRLTNETRLEPARALRIAHAIASALGAAHALGIVHRDLKPENVMIIERGEGRDVVKVLDFGIAKVNVEAVGTAKHGDDGAQRPLTRVGAVFGTPDYMAPEQGLGQPVDARADLYSLGVIVYEMLAGSRPFNGGAVTLIRQHVLEQVPPLAPEVLAQLDPRVDHLLKRLLAKTPEERIATAQAVCDELDEILRAPAGPPPSIVVHPPGAPAIAAPAEVASLPTLATGAAEALALEGAAVAATQSSPAAAAVAPSTPPALAPAGATAPGPATAPSFFRSRMRLVAIAGVAAFLLLAGGVYGVVRALSTSPTSTAADVDDTTAGEASDPNAASSAAPGDTTTPPPPGAARAATTPTAHGERLSASTAATAAPRAAAPAGVGAPSAPAEGDPAAAAGPGGGQPPPAPAPAHGKSASHGNGKGKGEQRSTGPGGIYIPPPDKWFK